MKIYEGEEDGVIGEFLYQTVEFDQTELVANGGVVSQSAAQRYLAKERPDLKIKKCGSFKLDSQANTITMRFAVVNKSITLAGADGSKIEGEKSEGGVSGDRKNHTATTVKLLNPGYDELKKDYAELFVQYAALVEAVSKDAQKFSDLLVENENLKEKTEEQITIIGNHAQGLIALSVENEKLKKQNVALAECAGIDISPEAPDVQIDVKDNKNQRPTEKATDKMLEDVINGPFSESAPTAEEISEAMQETIKDAANLGLEGEPELADGLTEGDMKRIKDADDGEAVPIDGTIG